MSTSVVDDILDRIDIVEYISEFIELKKSGSGFKGLCPFHGEKTPSFNVSPEKQIFKCFGCGVGGNVFEFHKNKFNLSFKEALKELAEKVGISLDNDNFSQEEHKKKVDLKTSIYEIYDSTLEFYRWFLQHPKFGREGRKYIKARSISLVMSEKFNIGLSPNSWDSLYLFLNKKGFSNEEILESGLIAKNKAGNYYDRFRNRLMFPIIDERNRVIAFGGRIIDKSKQAKYINSPETIIYTKGNHLYGLNFAKNVISEKGKVILVEGYLDVIACHSAGLDNTVATLGTALTIQQAKKILRYTPSKKVVVAYDSDEAGKKAAEKGTQILEEVGKGTGINIYILQIPSGKDPDDYIKASGAEQFKKIVNEALPILEFQIEQVLKSEDISTSLGKSEAVDKCIKKIMKVKDEIYRSELVKKVVNWEEDGVKLAVREEDIRKKLNIMISPYRKPFKKQWNKKNFQKKNYVSQEQQKINTSAFSYKEIAGLEKAEKGVIYFLVERPKTINYIFSNLEYIQFSNFYYEKIKNTILELRLQGIDVTWNKLLKELNESQEQNIISEIWENSQDINYRDDKVLIDFIKTIKLNSLYKQKEEIKSEMDHESDNNGLSNSYKELIEVYNVIKTEISKLTYEFGKTTPELV